MDKAKDEATNKLIAGQEKMGADIADLKTSQHQMGADIVELKAGQHQMGEDIVELKAGQQRMGEDIVELKTGQQRVEGLLNNVLDAVTRVERIVINIENDLRPKVHTLFDADKTRQNEINMVKEKCEEHEKRLDNHEMRITRLEE